MGERLRRALPAVIGLVLFVIALEVLRVELRAVSWHELTADVLNTPVSRLLLAFLLTALNYAVLTGYDFLAFSYVGRKLPPSHIAMTSLLAYAIANSVGFAALSGASVRYRFYTRWGVTGDELSRIVFSYSVTFWLGLLALGGVSLAVSPFPSAENLPAAALIRPVGWVLMFTTAAYMIATSGKREPLRIRQFELPLPSLRIAVAQLAISCVDWALAGAVLYVLLPPSDLSFVEFLGAFLAAILVGMVSHVPGGLGVFEGLMVLLLKGSLSSGHLLPALVVFRAIYYLLPFVIALVVLVADELHQRRAQAVRVGALLGRLTEQVTPRLLAIFTFLSGLVLLFSGATPSAPGRLALLARLLPVGVIEASTFLGSVAGAVLLLLSQGLSRRLDAAYYATLATIAIGMAVSFLKGFDYEEAALLAIVLLVLWRAGPAFDRRAAFFETRFSPGWIASVVAAIGASVWLGLFAFKHVAYSHELWWQFEIDGEVSRFLRASVGAGVVLLLFGVARLMAHAPHEAAAPSEADLSAASVVIAAQCSTLPNLVYLRDKALLFNEDKSAFVMYGVQGRTWVALGDPVGSPEAINAMIRLFLERCDDFGGIPIFYQIGKDHLHHYADFGFTFVKLGEEAKVDLSVFTLEGGRGKKHRWTVRSLEKDGATFRIIEPADVPAMMSQLRDVSNEWLKEKASAEKGFSLGFFDPSYVARFPVAVVERAGHLLAFATIWLGSGGQELSIDLMRYHPQAPTNVMEALFIHLITWGKAEGYRWFVLGMAPLSGFERSPIATLWNRLGAFLYEHGESVYNFQGLRAYKEKFDPTWEPYYLAYPGGLKLPRILADVSALIAGGYRRIFIK